MCTLQTGKLLYNAININYVLVSYAELKENSISHLPSVVLKAVTMMLSIEILDTPFNSEDSWTCLIHLQRLPLTRPLEGFFLSAET